MPRAQRLISKRPLQSCHHLTGLTIDWIAQLR
jgi:hypothetical protein